jgi:hypothetical protein
MSAAIAALILPCLNSPELFYIALDNGLHLKSVLHNCFGGDNPTPKNVTMLLLAFNAAEHYTPVCLLPSRRTRKSALLKLGTM